MNITTFAYLPATGWSVDPWPALDSARTLVLLFGDSHFLDTPAPIRAIAAAYPTSQIIGCSTSGEIAGARVVDGSLLVTVVAFAHTRLATAHAPVPAVQESYAAGQALGAQLAGPDLRSVLLFSDGLTVNGSELVRGLNAVLPPSVVVTGGLAGDGDRFQRTWVVWDGAPRAGFVVAAGLYGDRVQVGHGSKGGWDIFGPERRVTRATGNILYELDGKPALQLYKEYLGERAAGLPATALLFPLALRAHPDDEKSIVRTILGVDESTQSMIFAGDIPTGSLAQLMRANFDRLIDAAEAAALMTRERNSPMGPVLALAISCVGRRLILGERTEEELEAALAVLPEGTQQIGFYSYGEISPYAAGSCDLHNQTMTLTTIYES
ncbi:MAG TPA: FIST N-terminal domain-containing protein [Chloroflexia bacterium]|nr:FIST N-terminal domain-containing protein [Chloroflexia bacterium]